LNTKFLLQGKNTVIFSEKYNFVEKIFFQQQISPVSQGATA
jgi:hypothetical protein